ncbi:aspartic peptidase domain-containing protein, partial [Mycena olivaceomarginata]
PFIQPVLGQTYSAMSLTDYVPDGWLDLMYYGPVNVGTPPREMTVDIDTGSADLWFSKKQFKHSKSSTLKKSDEDFDVCYGSGEVSGKLWQDTVSIGGLVVDGQYFGAVSDLSGDFNDLPNDGLLGLAFGSIAQCGKPTFFENLRAKRKITSSMFSVHLARRPGRDNDDSAVCFGCIDPLKTLGSTIVYIPVICEAYWAVSMNAMVLIANKTVLRLPTSIRAIIDTGTSLIYLPQADVVKFYAAVRRGSTFQLYFPR